MNLRATIGAVIVLLAVAALIFQVFQRRLSEPLLAFGVHPDVLASLSLSMEDQRELANLAPRREVEFRQRFDQIESLLQNLRVIEHNRREIVGRFEQLMLALSAATTALVIAGVVVRQRRQQLRLDLIQGALAGLARGQTGIDVGDRRRDVIGRIARMIEEASERMARDRRRLRSLRNLSAWQEAARRHAHEMRTPLTAAKLELERVGRLAVELGGRERQTIESACESAAQELDRLRRFTRAFTSFARLPRPRLERRDLAALAAEFAETFGAAWENLDIDLGHGRYGSDRSWAEVDRDMLRQVLVNLCDNSSSAVGDERRGRIELRVAPDPRRGMVTIDVADDGPGVAEEVADRLFEPYTTTKQVGDGMGLGLAICKKIMLDHGGDLELVASGETGSTFRLSLVRSQRSENDT